MGFDGLTAERVVVGERGLPSPGMLRPEAGGVLDGSQEQGDRPKRTGVRPRHPCAGRQLTALARTGAAGRLAKVVLRRYANGWIRVDSILNISP